MTDPGIRGVVEVAAHARYSGQITHENEQRQDRQRFDRRGLEGVRRQRRHGAARADHPVADKADEHHRRRHRHAQRQQQQQNAEPGKTDFDVRHNR